MYQVLTNNDYVFLFFYIFLHDRIVIKNRDIIDFNVIILIKGNKIMQNIKLQLYKELENYLDSKNEFLPYYPGMNILTSPLYKEQLKEVIKYLEKENSDDAKSFELYLDTVIINMQTKVKKYKHSIYFDNENIKDIENQGYTIPFYIDEEKSVYVLLGLVKV
jgi:hypothetical protein